MTLLDKQTASLNPSANIGIVGAGLMGRLTALSLIRQGHQVTLIDRDNKDGRKSAGYAAAGLLTPLGESLHCEANIVEMGIASLKLWPEILSTLQQTVYFQQYGAIMISHEQDQGDYLRFSRYVKHHYAQHNLQSLNRQQLNQLEPELGRSFQQGLLLAQEGQIDNRQLLNALQKQLELEGITWLCNSNVSQLTPSSNGYRVGLDNTTLDFDLVVDCRGIGAKTDDHTKLAQSLNDLRAVRGEVFRLYAPEVQLSRPIRLMHPRYQLYIAPKPDGMFLVGATEIESDDDSPMTVRSAMELLSAAYSVHPGFAEANIVEQISQLRPAFSDNQPKIQMNGRLIQVNGLYRHGYLIAPVVLKQVEQAVNQNLKLNSADEPKNYSSLLPIKNAS